MRAALLLIPFAEGNKHIQALNNGAKTDEYFDGLLGRIPRGDT